LMGFSVHLRIHNLTGYQRTGYSRVNGYCSGGSKLVAVKTLLGLSLVADLIHCYMFTLLLIHSFKTQQGQAGWLLAVSVAVNPPVYQAIKIYYWDLTDTMHKRPAGKIRWMSFSKRFDNASVCYTKPLDSLKNWNDHFFWVDDFDCPASFPWHTTKHITRDPAPVSADFNAQDYATLVAHPSPFRKFPEAFLYLVGLGRHYTLDKETYSRFLHKNGEEMNIFAFIHTLDPTKVGVVERERNKDELRLLDTTIGRTVSLIPVARDRAGSKSDTSRKRKSVIVDMGGASYPPKKLREDHETPSGTSVYGKYRSTIKRLLAEAVLNAEVGVAAIPTLPFVTPFMSSTLKREVGDHTDSVAEPNLCTIGAPRRFVISSDSSHHSGTNIAEAEVDSLIRSSAPIMTTVTTVTSTVDPASVAKEKLVELYIFCANSSSAGGTDPTTGVFSDLTGSDFLVGAIHTIINPDADLQKTYVPQWSVTNGFRLDDGRVCREMVDEFAHPKFFASVRGMEHDQRFIEFNVGAARQMSLNVEVRMHAEYNVKEKKSLRDETNALKERNAILEKERNALDMKVTELEASAAGKERELTDLNTLITSVKSQNDNLVDRVHELETSSFGLQEKVTMYQNCMEQLEKFQDDQMKVVNDKFDKLYTDFVEMALHLEEKFYPHLLTTISSRIWLLTQGMELAIIKCLNSPEYLSALGAAIGKAIEKGMQDGLSAGITHGKKGRILTNVYAHNLYAEVDYISTLQQLQNVNFPLLVELKSNKDASIETVMDILRLERPLVDKLGLDELQPNVDQLMVPIHHSPDKAVIGATALSLALDVSSVWVRKIKENIANQRLALRDVFVPLSEPFSAAVLTGTEGTSDIVSATADTTTALSTTFASTSSVAPISVDDYEVIGADDQAVADGNAASFPNVDDAELNIVQ
ncbi:hypothetical protein Tco_0415478, partial [Tanacetum coccineum]